MKFKWILKNIKKVFNRQNLSTLIIKINKLEKLIIMLLKHN